MENKKKKKFFFFFFFFSNWEFFAWNWEKTYFLALGMGPNFGPKIGWSRALNQLLPQLLMEQFDTLPIQCRYIEHMHEGVYFRKNIF